MGGKKWRSLDWLWTEEGNKKMATWRSCYSDIEVVTVGADGKNKYGNC